MLMISLLFIKNLITKMNEHLKLLTYLFLFYVIKAI